jgi:hypothetical protein
MRTNVSSETTQTREEFRTNLLDRDFCCVWTGVGARYGAGLHIIPYKRGSEVRSTLCAGKISDPLPFCYFSGFGSS